MLYLNNMKKVNSNMVNSRNHFVDYINEYSTVLFICFAFLFLLMSIKNWQLQMKNNELQEKYDVAWKLVLQYKEQIDFCKWKIEAIKSILDFDLK